MKPYFAKCLPVDEEIREGDNYISDRGDIFVDKPGTKHYKGDRKIKLFLCSRDIQIGDEYTCPHKGKGIDVGFGQPVHVQVFMIYTKERNLCPKCYKRIGEISPEAKWVKEGDEFDEDEIYYVGGFQGLIPDNYTEVNSLIEIKGPCGHFH